MNLSTILCGQLVTISDAALYLIYTLYSSLLPTQKLLSSVFTSRILVTDLWQSHCNCSTYEVFIAPPNSLLAIIVVCPSIYLTTSNSLLQTVLLITSRHEPHRKHRFLAIPLLLQRHVYLAVAYNLQFFCCCMRIHFSRSLFTAHCLAMNYPAFRRHITVCFGEMCNSKCARALFVIWIRPVMRVSHIILVYYQLLIKNEVFWGNQPSLVGMDAIHSILTRPTTREEWIAFIFSKAWNVMSCQC
jgi:hypothetical protein